jgi:NADPH:quinone reductase-like Zn-dependent oxidoreductase
MKAAVVEAFDRAPRYGDFDTPVVREEEVLISVQAAALSQLVRAQASGNHYSSGTPPFVPGVDGVGVLDNGKRVYFAFPRTPVGAMAERVAVKSELTVLLPDDVDNVTAAAIANPGMSSWAALTKRAYFKPGESVLINGANGASGRLAIQIAKHLGAARVIATGRNPGCEAELRALGAAMFVPLLQTPEALAQRFRDEIADGVDVVLDYLWGPSAAAFLNAATGHGTGAAARRIRFVNIGSLGGASIPLTATALRSSGLEIMGSGLGSVSHVALVQSIGKVMQAIKSANLKIDATAVPLADVEAAWSAKSDARVVFTL